MRILFVRHTSVAVEPGVCYGQTDVPLGESFVSEAAAVRERLRGERVDAAFSSPLMRCVRLAEACGFASPVVDRRLMEMNFGAWEMRRYEEISDPRLQLWYDDYLHVAPTGGESSMEQRARLASFLSDLRAGSLSASAGSLSASAGSFSGGGSAGFPPESGQAIAVFTHGGIIIHALVLLAGLTYAEAYARQPRYGEIIALSLPARPQ